MSYLLDTNTVIYFFKGQGAVAKHLLQRRPGQVALSIITVYELEVGIAKSAAPGMRRQQLSRFLDVVQVLPFGLAEARMAARIRANLERRGTSIGPLDNLLAGTAMTRSSSFVTRNVAEFQRVDGLSVVDWYD
ncbi:MAG: type II toxin-antitoxin system VapC family toxin [Nannocystaceae bacterium]